MLGLMIGLLVGRIFTYRILKHARKHAVNTSHHVILGGVYEKILPALPNFPYSPKDMTFIGKWIDYIVFDGLSEGNLREIIFLELKSGKSTLNRNEQAIRACLEHKRVRYSEYRIASTK